MCRFQRVIIGLIVNDTPDAGSIPDKGCEPSCNLCILYGTYKALGLLIGIFLCALRSSLCYNELV